MHKECDKTIYNLYSLSFGVFGAWYAGNFPPGACCWLLWASSSPWASLQWNLNCKMLSKRVGELSCDWSMLILDVLSLADPEASNTVLVVKEVIYTSRTELCETFNIAGTSGSYLKTLGNCLPRNNILTSGKCGKVSLETRLGAWQNNHHLDCGHRVNIYIQTSKYSDTDTSSNQLDDRLSTFSFMYCTAHV